MDRPQPTCMEVIGKASLEILGFVVLILLVVVNLLGLDIVCALLRHGLGILSGLTRRFIGMEGLTLKVDELLNKWNRVEMLGILLLPFPIEDVLSFWRCVKSNYGLEIFMFDGLLNIYPLLRVEAKEFGEQIYRLRRCIWELLLPDVPCRELLLI